MFGSNAFVLGANIREDLELMIRANRDPDAGGGWGGRRARHSPWRPTFENIQTLQQDFQTFYNSPAGPVLKDRVRKRLGHFYCSAKIGYFLFYSMYR